MDEKIYKFCLSFIIRFIVLSPINYLLPEYLLINLNYGSSNLPFIFAFFKNLIINILQKCSMQKRHRRSIIMDDENNANDENRQNRGTFYPKLFEDDDDGNGNCQQQIGWKPRLNKSCPDTATYSLMEDQQEEDEENSDEEEEANEARKCRQRQARRLGSQSLPDKLSRSRSATNWLQQKTPSPIFGEKAKQKQQKGFSEYFHENLNHPIEYNQLISFTVIVVIIIFACAFIYPIFIARRQLTPEQQFSNFKNDLRRLIDEEIPLNNKERRTQTWKMLIYMADKMLKRNSQQGEEKDEEKMDELEKKGPMILLMAGKDGTKVERMSQQFEGILQKNWPNYGFMKHTLDSVTTKMGMEKEVLEPILERQRIKPEMLLLHLKGIDKLRHTSPLFLHSLADSESSPLLQTPHNIFIIGTIQLATNLEDAEQMNCPELIENSLSQSWHSDALSVDQIHPIISRISAHPICLD